MWEFVKIVQNQKKSTHLSRRLLCADGAVGEIRRRTWSSRRRYWAGALSVGAARLSRKPFSSRLRGAGDMFSRRRRSAKIRYTFAAKNRTVITTTDGRRTYETIARPKKTKTKTKTTISTAWKRQTHSTVDRAVRRTRCDCTGPRRNRRREPRRFPRGGQSWPSADDRATLRPAPRPTTATVAARKSHVKRAKIILPLGCYRPRVGKCFECVRTSPEAW